MPDKLDLMERLRRGMNVRAPDLAIAVGMSRAAFYAAIERGEVEAVRIGRSKLVPAHEGCRLLGIKSAP